MEARMTAELAAALHVAGRSVYDYTIPARASWSHVVRKGQTLRIIDLEGNQAVDCILYSAADPAERYSAQETIAAQNKLFLPKGSKLVSNESNVLMTLVADTVGRHDTIGGACSC